MHSVMATGKQSTAQRMLNFESEGSGQPFAAQLIGATPTVTGLACIAEKVGPFVSLKFTFTAMPMTCTDAAGSGSSGSVKIFDFVANGIQPLCSRQDYTIIDSTGDSDLISGGVGDQVQVLGLGSVAADAGDGALTGTEVDFAPVTGNITSASGLGAGTKFGGAGTVVDGTSTAADLYLNWSATAATSDANGALEITGTVTLLLALLGDD